MTSRYCIVAMLVHLAAWQTAIAADPIPDKAKAIDAIHRRGGKIVIDVKRKDRPVVEAHFFELTDDEMFHIRAFTKIQKLSISVVTDVTMSHVGQLITLTHLRLSNNRHISGTGLAHISGLKDLKFLDLHGTYVSGDDLKHLSLMDKLETLDVANTRLTDASLIPLKSLPRLTALDLSGNDIKGTTLGHLDELTKLKVLFLADTTITDATLAQVASLRKLETLSLRGVGISDSGIMNLRKLRRLKTLDVTKTQVTNAGARQLKKVLRRVKFVWLHRHLKNYPFPKG